MLPVSAYRVGERVRSTEQPAPGIKPGVLGTVMHKGPYGMFGVYCGVMFDSYAHGEKAPIAVSADEIERVHDDL